MNKPSFSDPIDPAVQRLIESMAGRFSRFHGLSRESAEDLTQILAIKYLHLRDTADPEKLANWGFLQGALRNRCRSYLRELNAKMRRPDTPLLSLESGASESHGRSADLRHTLHDPRSNDEVRRRDLRRKLKEIGRSLPAIQRLQDQIDRTGRKPMPSQLKRAARESGFRSVDEMCQFFEDKGLRDLL